jgi:hypothetical protein
MQTATTPKRRSAPTTMRASYSIPTKTLQGFNATIPAGERSEVIAQLMKIALAERETALEKIAETYINDPAFAQCREDEKLWDVTVGDGLENV